MSYSVIDGLVCSILPCFSYYPTYDHLHMLFFHALWFPVCICRGIVTLQACYIPKDAKVLVIERYWIDCHCMRWVSIFVALVWWCCCVSCTAAGSRHLGWKKPVMRQTLNFSKTFMRSIVGTNSDCGKLLSYLYNWTGLYNVWCVLSSAHNNFVELLHVLHAYCRVTQHLRRNTVKHIFRVHQIFLNFASRIKLRN